MVQSAGQSQERPTLLDDDRDASDSDSEDGTLNLRQRRDAK